MQLHKGVDFALISHAEENKQPIRNLETIASRLDADKQISSEKDHLLTKKLGIAAIATLRAQNKFKAFVTSPDAATEDQLFDIYVALTDAIKVVDFGMKPFSPGAEDMNVIANKLKDLIELCTVVFTAILKDTGQEAMATAHILIDACKQFDKGESPIFEEFAQQVEESYAEGKKQLPKPPTRREALDAKVRDLLLKSTHLRDRFMLQTINDNLTRSSKQNRSFYAVGCAHILEDYTNLRILLERQGWKILDAYA